MDEGRLIKTLDIPAIFTQDADQQAQIFWHMYLILKPNEEKINDSTKRWLQMIEECVSERSESVMYGKHLDENVCMAKYGFKNGRLHRLDGCDEKEEATVSINHIIHQTFPPSPKRAKISPDSDESSGIECDIGENNNSASPSPSRGALLPPPPISLIAPLKVPISTRSSEIVRLCQLMKQQRAKNPTNPIFDDSSSNPILPVVPSETKCLTPKTPLFYVKSRSDAMSLALRDKCLEAPICVIRGLAHAVDIDLSKFTTKNVEQLASDYEIELRSQPISTDSKFMDGRKNWNYNSVKCRTHVGRYSKYQGDSFASAIKEGFRILRDQKEPTKALSESPQISPETSPTAQRPSRKRKFPSEGPKTPNGRKAKIYFGTNVDFSEKMFNEQVAELHKLPPFCTLAHDTNFLSHLGYDLKGMNTAQFYMKIPGCRTPAHLENNSFCSVNLNIGPGDCEWFGVSYEYYPLIDQMCKERRLDFLNSSWWPDYKELIDAGIPVYRFVQKCGDIVWINGGCVHWVESKGWCNNIAWNVGPSTVEQYKLNLLSTEFNRSRNFQSLIPMQHLSWNIAKNRPIDDPELRNLIRGVLIRSLAHTQMVHDFVQTELKKPILFIESDAGRSTTDCSGCMVEIFNIIFLRPKRKNNDGAFTGYDEYCLDCANRIGFTSMEVWQVFKLEDLCEILDRF